MITKAIIVQILDDGYHAKVRIPTINKAAESASATPDDALYTASICCGPGCSPSLRPNDVVFVSYENNMEESPVIVGLLFRKIKTNTSVDIDANSLNVNINCKLPSSTSIGDVSSTDIERLKNTKGSIQGQIDTLSERSGRNKVLTTTKNDTVDIYPFTTTIVNSPILKLKLGDPNLDYDNIYKVTWCPMKTPSYVTPVMPRGFTLKYDNLPTWEANKIYQLQFEVLNESYIGLTVTTW